MPKVIEETLDDSSIIDYLTQASVDKYQKETQRAYVNTNNPKTKSNFKYIKNFLFNRSASNREPQRLNSQLSTATASTYMSSTISSSSEGLPSSNFPNKGTNKSTVKRNSSNAFEDEDENLLPSKSSSLSPSSLTASRSNSNSSNSSNNSANSYDFNKHDIFLTNNRNSQTNSNSGKAILKCIVFRDIF